MAAEWAPLSAAVLAKELQETKDAIAAAERKLREIDPQHTQAIALYTEEIAALEEEKAEIVAEIESAPQRWAERIRQEQLHDKSLMVLEDARRVLAAITHEFVRYRRRRGESDGDGGGAPWYEHRPDGSGDIVDPAAVTFSDILWAQEHHPDLSIRESVRSRLTADQWRTLARFHADAAVRSRTLRKGQDGRFQVVLNSFTYNHAATYGAILQKVGIAEEGQVRFIHEYATSPLFGALISAVAADSATAGKSQGTAALPAGAAPRTAEKRKHDGGDEAYSSKKGRSPKQPTASRENEEEHVTKKDKSRKKDKARVE